MRKNLWTSYLFFGLATLAAVAFIAPNAKAESAVMMSNHVSFHVDSNPGFSGKVYYDCDGVETQLTSFLKQLGAQRINVQCTGGIDRYTPSVAWEAEVDLRFDSLRLTKPGASGSVPATFRKVSVFEWDGCYLLTQAFAELQQSFDLKNVSGPSACFNSSSRFRLELTTLFP